MRYYYGGVASATFDVVAGTLQLSALSVSPSPVIGGNGSTGTVTLSLAAPAGGIVVTLTSANTGVASVPTSVTVAQGQTTATFTVATTVVTASTNVTLSGSYNGVTQTAVLTVNPVPVLSALSVSPSSVIGGSSATGTATLTSPAGPGGLVVGLSSSNTTVATTPASVTIASGQTSATFSVTTSNVAASTGVTLSGVYGGVTKTATLTVTPPTLNSFSLSPGTTSQGQTVTGYLYLNGPAPTGGAAVAISLSNSQAALFPGTVTVPAGQTSASFSIATSTVNYPVTVTFTASLYGSSLTAPLTLTPGNLHITDLVAPYSAKLTWDCQATGNFVLKRDGATIATLANSVSTYTDAFAPAFTNGQTYYYEIFDSAAPGVHLSATKVVPYQVNASDNQAVDSRLDLRYATNVFLDHCFGATSYRGGLFTGFSSDPSRIGRSYAKFGLVAPATGLTFRAGNLNAYCTGAQTSGTQTVQMQVICQTLTDTSWQSGTMVWSTLTNQNLNPTNAESLASIYYDPTVTPNPTPGWTAWPMSASLQNALASPQTPYAVAWTSSNEAAAGWAYFAKREFDSTLSPAATYAYELPIPIQITFTPNTLAGGGTLMVSRVVNGVGLGDSAVVALSQTHSGTTTVTNFPSSVTVTGTGAHLEIHLLTVFYGSHVQPSEATKSFGRLFCYLNLLLAFLQQMGFLRRKLLYAHYAFGCPVVNRVFTRRRPGRCRPHDGSRVGLQPVTR
ncbi:MAG: hypothetical protein JWL77_494 [Chthonomonadaceae bacterium]|nr:hypothetical protein [Chthonomonadaceae bacterium]